MRAGTCVSTLEPSCYTSYQQYEEVLDFFQTVVNLFQSLPTFDWLAAAGIRPSTTQTYTLDQLQAVARDNFGYDVVWKCDGDVLNAVWYGTSP